MSHTLTHSTDVNAPASVVYDLIADATLWPRYFKPTVHVERTALADDGSLERLQIWAVANGKPTSWTSRRELDRAAGRVTFRQEVSTPPVASMSGTWTITAIGDGACRLTLDHEFTAVGDDPAGIAWITEATDSNSQTELANIKSIAENHASVLNRELVFAGSVDIDGSVDAAYDFIYQAKLWPDRLPHVDGLDIAEDTPNVQEMSMITLAKDGSTHTTESVRVCFPGERIVYKQTTPPSLMTAHVGEWSFEAIEGGVRVTSWHAITLREDTIPSVLGPDATLQESRTFVYNAAGGNSKITLEHAKRFIEGGAEIEDANV